MQHGHLVLVVVVVLGLAAPRVLAHPQHTAVGDRYVKLVAEGGGLRVVYSLSYGPIGAAAVRRSMDADHDGRLTPAESAAGARALGDRIAREGHLRVDGTATPLVWATPFVAPNRGAVDTSPLTIELSANVVLGGGETTVSFEDVPALDGVERSDYAFEARMPAELLASGQGDEPTGKERLVSFLDRRAQGRRVVSMRVRLPATSGTWGWLGAGLAFGVGLVGLLGWKLARGRRARSRAKVSEPRTGT